MKKKLIVISMLIISAAVCAFFLWPYSFSTIAPDCSSITVIYIEDTLEHGNETKVFTSGTEHFTQIESVLKKYSYHRSFRTFFDDDSLDGNHAGYWLHIYLDSGDDRKVVICGGTGEISIDERVYRVGYWGDGASLDFMKEMVKAFNT